MILIEIRIFKDDGSYTFLCKGVPKFRDINVRPYEGIYVHIIFTIYSGTVIDYLYICLIILTTGNCIYVQAIELDYE